MQGKCNRPPKWGLITTNNDVILEPNMQLDLLFKFMTTRDSNPSASQSSKSVIKKRSITLVVVMSNGQIYQQVQVDIQPCMAMIDHTFRFYEPEESHF